MDCLVPFQPVAGCARKTKKISKAERVQDASFFLFGQRPYFTMNRISLPQHQPNSSIGQGRTGSHSTVASVGTRLESVGAPGVAPADGFTEGQHRLSSWMPDKLSGCRQWLEVGSTL